MTVLVPVYVVVGERAEVVDVAVVAVELVYVELVYVETDAHWSMFHAVQPF